MNPLTLVKRIQNINAKEAALGISEEASWHAKYKDSAYVFAGGMPFDLTEGDLLAVFAQYGEIVDVNLVRDKGTGKSKGFAFIAYEDQRSTNLAVDNLNGAQISGRTIRVDHVSKYKKKEEEDEEAEQQKREERGVCRAFQRGECNRGAGCKFSHDERRAANTGWGHDEDRRSRWANDRFEGSTSNRKQSGVSDRILESSNQEGRGLTDRDSRGSRVKTDSDRHYEHGELSPRDRRHKVYEKRLDRKERYSRHSDERNSLPGRESRTRDIELNSGEDRNRRDNKRSRKYEDESYKSEDRDGGGLDKRSIRDKGASPNRPRKSDDDHRLRSRK